MYYYRTENGIMCTTEVSEGEEITKQEYEDILRSNLEDMWEANDEDREKTCIEEMEELLLASRPQDKEGYRLVLKEEDGRFYWGL